jgi:hypothetical protein
MTFCLYSTINRTISSDCGESYDGSNSGPSFAMAAIVVMTFHADGSRRSVPRSYVRKSDVVVVKNSPCQVDLVVWALFLTDRTDNI